MNKISLVLACAALTGAACSSTTTELLVVVDSDLTVPTELAFVRVVVRSATTLNEQVSYLFDEPFLRFPMSFGVGAGADPRPPVIIDFEALDPDGNLLFLRRVQTNFIEGKTLALPVLLSRACVGKSCGDGLTCVDGACVDPAVDVSTLCETSAPGCSVTPGPDGGAPDAGPADPDAAAPDAPAVDLDATVAPDAPPGADAGPAPGDGGQAGDGGQVGLPWWRGNRRAPVALTFGAASERGDSVSVVFDHAAWVRDHGARPDGSDLRVARYDGASWVELDRVLDPGSDWNRADTRLWIAPGVAAASGARDEATYLYAGDATGSPPPARATSVFTFYDDFERGDTTAWAFNVTDNGSATADRTFAHRGTFALRASVAVGNGVALVQATPPGGMRALVTTAWLRAPAAFDNDDAYPLFYCGNGCNFDVPFGQIGGARVPAVGQAPGLVYYSTQGTRSVAAGTTPFTADVWHRVELKTLADPAQGRAELWVDGARAAQLTAIDTRDAVVRINVGLFYKSDAAAEGTLYADDVFVRPWRDPEPAVVVGAIESR